MVPSIPPLPLPAVLNLRVRVEFKVLIHNDIFANLQESVNSIKYDGVEVKIHLFLNQIPHGCKNLIIRRHIVNLPLRGQYKRVKYNYVLDILMICRLYGSCTSIHVKDDYL